MKRLLSLAFFLVLLVGAPAGADTLVTLVGVGGAYQGGVYVVPYFLKVNNHNLSVMCDDYLHEVHIGESWHANIVPFSAVSSGRFWNPSDPATSLHDYEMAFWLFSQWQSHPSQAGNINFAVWAIFDPAVIGHSGWTTGPNAQLNSASAWLYAAEHFTGPFDYSSFYLVVPTDLSSAGPQEYIGRTPEPAALALVGTGFLALGLLRRRILGG